MVLFSPYFNCAPDHLLIDQLKYVKGKAMAGRSDFRGGRPVRLMGRWLDCSESFRAKGENMPLWIRRLNLCPRIPSVWMTITLMASLCDSLSMGGLLNPFQSTCLVPLYKCPNSCLCFWVGTQNSLWQALGLSIKTQQECFGKVCKRWSAVYEFNPIYIEMDNVARWKLCHSSVWLYNNELVNLFNDFSFFLIATDSASITFRQW